MDTIWLKRRRHEDYCLERTASYFLTFISLSTTLLVFFIFLIAQREKDIVRQNSVVSGIKQIFSFDRVTPLALHSQDFKRLASLLQSYSTTLENQENSLGFTISHRMLFDENQFSLDASAQLLLQELRKLARDPLLMIEINIHTTKAKERPDTSWEESIRQAQVISRALAKNGPLVANIQIQAHGAYKPKISSDDPLSAAINERVEFSIRTKS